MKNQEIKTNIEVDGVILTEKAINMLRELQDNNNENIDFVIKVIHKAIRIVVRNIDNYEGDEMLKIHELLVNLAYICEWMEDFEKP